jgi:DNA-directed RNA polymerase specialized sigma24 family protein
MSTAGDDTASTREDELLVGVYRHLIGAWAAQYAAAWDAAAGLARFTGWLRDHAEPAAEPAPPGLLEHPAARAALAGLPERQREAIVLRYYAGLSEGEIAAAMAISRGAVASHTARGLSVLRAALEQASPHQPADSDDAGSNRG